MVFQRTIQSQKSPSMDVTCVPRVEQATASWTGSDAALAGMAESISRVIVDGQRIACLCVLPAVQKSVHRPDPRAP